MGCRCVQLYLPSKPEDFIKQWSFQFQELALTVEEHQRREIGQVRHRALSVRQPWAWAIIYCGKDMENRSQAAVKVMSGAVGERIFIHAARGINRRDFEDALDIIERMGVTLPAPEEMELGGVIGSARIENIVRASHSPWFTGPCALHFSEPRPLPFFEVKGQLNLFYVTRPDGVVP